MVESMRGTRFTSLPIECITDIISRTSPPDASRMSMVAADMRFAADSDAVWENFLPDDYDSIVAGAVDSLRPDIQSGKELYLRLSDKPILIEDGRKSFWLEKESGKKCYMLGGRDLSIVWSGTPMYWTWNPLPQSRFAEVAHLNIVWWLEIKGKMNANMLSPNTNYAFYLVFQRNDKFNGFEGNPLESWVGIVGSEVTKRVIYLDPKHHHNINRSPGCPGPAPDPAPTRMDGWCEVELGEFFNDQKIGKNEQLEMSIMEVKTCNAKHGLLIEGIEIRPK